MGLGWACILGPSTVLGISSVPQQVGSVAMGSLMTLHNVGGGLGLAVGVGLYRIRRPRAGRLHGRGGR